MSVDNLTDQEIMAMLAEKDVENVERDAKYDEYDRVLFKNEFSDRLGSTLDDQLPMSKRNNLLHNLAWGKVKDKATALNQVPDIKVPVTPGSGEDGKFWAEFLSYYYYNNWQFSNIQNILQYHGFCLSAYGTAITLAVPDMEAKRIRILAKHPRTLSCEALGNSNHEYAWVGFTYELNGRQLLDTYPTTSKYDIDYNQQDYKVRELWTPNKRLFFVEGKNQSGKHFSERIPGLGVEHKLGFIPVRITPNVLLPGKIEGMNDIEHSLAAQDNINEIAMLYTEQLREQINPLLVIKSGKDLPEVIPTGRGAYIEVEADGDVRYVPRVSAGFEVNSHLSQQWQNVREIMNFPPTRSGFPVGSGTVTGKGQYASQSSVTADLESVQRAVGNDLVLINGYCQRMEKKMWPSKKQRMYVTMAINKKMEGDVSHYYPEDLPDFYEHSLKFYPMGYDGNLEAVKLLQLAGQGMISKRTVRENLPNINPDEEDRRIKEERAQEMEEMAMQQQLMAPPAPPEGAMPPGQAEADNMALELGGMPEMPMEVQNA